MSASLHPPQNGGAGTNRRRRRLLTPDPRSRLGKPDPVVWLEPTDPVEEIMPPEPQLFDPASKKTGLAHLFAATQYSVAGCKRLLKEAAFRHEIVSGVLLMIVYWIIGVSLMNAMISLCLILITLAVEAINTAIELVIDRTSPEVSDYGRDAKDLGSFAVMCLLIANGVFALFAIVSALF
jgi:diacylglycerol kinase (ATP)